MARSADQAPQIRPHTTVREAIERYPGIESVFDRHGLRGCGGPDGPVEEIGFFARVHQVDPAALLRELNQYASGHVAATALPLMDRRPRLITQPYIIAITASLAIALLGGFPLGILAALGGGHDVGLGFRWPAIVQAHGHLQLIGFVAIFIAGIAFHALPRFKNTDLALPRMAIPAIALLGSGAILRTLAQPWADEVLVAPFVVMSAALELAGAVALVAIVWRTLRSAQRKNYDLFLMAGGLWFAAAAITNLVLLAQLAADGERVISTPRNAPLLDMYLLGFVTLFVLGVSIRVLPHFVSLRPPAVAFLAPTLALINAGLLVRIGSGWTDALTSWSRPDWVGFASATVLLTAIALFIYSLNLHHRSARDESSAAPGRHELMIRTAYVWLLIAVGIDLWFAVRAVGSDFSPDFLQGGAARHALAVGFITQMIIGVGSRALPAFAGKRLYSQQLVVASWLAINAAAALRVGPALAPWGSTTLRFDHIAAAGALGMIALAIFAYNIARTMMPARQRPAPMDLPLVQAVPQRQRFTPAPDSVVADVLREVPGSLELLIGKGLKPLADPDMRARMTPRITLATACSMHNIDIHGLITDLSQLQDEHRGNS